MSNINNLLEDNPGKPLSLRLLITKNKFEIGISYRYCH